MMRSTRRIAEPSTQFDLFGKVPGAADAREVRNAVERGRRFVDGNRAALFVGTVHLAQYLRDVKEHTALKVSRLLDEQDWRMFELRYAASGRAPYAPRAMMGLILYGVMKGVHSLRDLERLARLDLGCLWVSGAIMPDHANIGRFIVMHDALLAQDFFESLTAMVLRACGAKSTRVAGDGTVIEAACSHYKLLKEEAVKEHARLKRQAAAQSSDDGKAQQRAVQAGRCEMLFEQRKAARIKRGKDTASLCVSGSRPAEALFDTGYFHDEVIEAALARDISLLCPAPPGEHNQSGGKFHKSQFDYNPGSDTYYCPAGQVLHRMTRVAASAATREHVMYACASCAGCTLRQRCTTAQARRIKRYPQDPAREALRQVMQQPGAQRVFRQRKAMVEPVFARLRGQQHLNRFRRRGLAAVTREFALHVLAYNLGRAVALLQAMSGLLLACSWWIKRIQSDRYTFDRIIYVEHAAIRLPGG